MASVALWLCCISICWSFAAGQYDPVTTDAKTPLIPRKSYNYQNSTREATTNHSSAGVLGTGSSWAEATNVSHVTSGTPTSTTVLTSDPALACNIESWKYLDRSWKSRLTTATETFTSIYVLSSTKFYVTHTCSSTCGKICYADATTTDTSVFFTTRTDFDTYPLIAPYTAPTPNCTIPPASCTSLWEVYNYESASIESWERTATNWYPYPTMRDRPLCYIPATTTREPDPPQCFIAPGGGGKLQMIYWPVPDSVVRDMCTDYPDRRLSTLYRNASSTWTPTSTGPFAVVGTHTFFSGNAYLSLRQVSARDGNLSPVGKTYTNVLLTMASSQITTMRQDTPGWLNLFPVNFADFNLPIPWSAYKGALPECNSVSGIPPQPLCTSSIVINEDFYPYITLPDVFRSLDPAWAICTPQIIMPDPPIRLTAVGYLVSTPLSGPSPLVTPTLDPTWIPPQPGPGVISTVPSITLSHTPMTPVAQITNNGEGRGGDVMGQGPISYAPPAAITIGPQTFPFAAGGGSIVLDSGISIHPGGPAITMNGVTLSVGLSSIMTLTFPSGETRRVPLNGAATQPFQVIIGGQTLTVDGQGNLVLPGKTLRPGDAAVTVSSRIISIGEQGVVIIDLGNGETKTIPFPRPAVGTKPTTGGKDSTNIDNLIPFSTRSIVIPTPTGSSRATGAPRSKPNAAAHTTSTIPKILYLATQLLWIAILWID